MRTVAIIAAGGRGKRAGGGIPKQFRPLVGRLVLARTVALFQAVDAIDSIVLVVPRGYVQKSRDEIVRRYRLTKVDAVVAGGRERQESVHKAIRAIGGACDLICIHDGARPLVEPALVKRTIRAAAKGGAAIAARPISDTIKRADPDGTIAATLDRSLLWAATTPQVFAADVIREAYDRATAEGCAATDDAQLVERLGRAVWIVPDNPENLKLTTESDFRVAAAILRARGKTR